MNKYEMMFSEDIMNLRNEIAVLMATAHTTNQFYNRIAEKGFVLIREEMDEDGSGDSYKFFSNGMFRFQIDCFADGSIRFADEVIYVESIMGFTKEKTKGERYTLLF